jgi:hypothetical protein
MATGKKDTPDLFAEEGFDPVSVATGSAGTTPGENDVSQQPARGKTDTPPKKKAGFYLSREILDRFALKFYELKLAGVPVDNKSALLELSLCFALDDLDKGQKSHVLQRIYARGKM